MTSGSEAKMLQTQIPTALPGEEFQIPAPETREENDNITTPQGQHFDISNEDQTEDAVIEPEEPRSTAPENARHRRSSLVSYKEPSVRSKLRAGDQFTFSSGYEAGIKILSMAERDRDRAKRRSRQSLS
jgi:hypothetical protein